jgi:hypothetical protein
VSADEIPGLADPLVLRDRLYLRRTGGVVRTPGPPALLAAGGATAAGLGLYRHLDGEPHGGGFVWVVLDLGAPSAAGDQADAALPAEVRDVAAPVHAEGRARLLLGGAELASGPVPGGIRPVVPLAAGLDMTAATLLRSILDDGAATALGAAATGSLVVSGGPRGRVDIDLGRARAELAGTARLTGADVADALDRLVELGVVRVTVEESFAPLPRWPILASAAAALFEPVVTDHPWTAVPGVRLPGYAPDARWQAVAGPAGGGSVSLTLDGTRLPWAGAAPLHLDRTALSTWDLPGTGVVDVAVLVNGPWPADVSDPAIEVRVGDGPVTTVPLTAEFRSVRVVPPDGSRAYAWRVTAHRGGRPVAGAWTTSGDSNLILDPGQQLAADVTSGQGVAT